ncbi:fibrinogen C domain-containing protein 1-like [Hyalella azteca]|uniref:Fibrinogen C domain-containing protein 1-like n=1 Tax=Hyalella azteca TaxID=294128 RepID=A0A8B7NDC0_HYAAZ|nr:fibrinogen C domain-containing protein 1-like [Hyalella azteca]
MGDAQISASSSRSLPHQRYPPIGDVDECLGLVKTALDILDNPESVDDIKYGNFDRQQQEIYDSLKELSEYLANEANGMVPLIPADCSERPEKTSGVYTIYPSGAAVQVYCDQTTDGGGWTVFLRRQKQEPQLNFSRTFKEYEEGFGSPTGEYWLGLRNLHLLTSRKLELKAVIVRGAESTSSHYLYFE